MIKQKRSVSEMFLRFKHPDTGTENRCFEDLPVEEQRKYLEKISAEEVIGIALLMAFTLREICDEFDITRENERT